MLSEVTLAAHITLGTNSSGKLGSIFRQNAEDSAFSLAVQLRNEAIICALLDNLRNALIHKRKKLSTHFEGSRLGFELAILKAINYNCASLLRLILEANYVREMLMPVIVTVIPKILEYTITATRLKSVNVLLTYFGTSISVNQKALNIALLSAASQGHIILTKRLIHLGADINPGPDINPSSGLRHVNNKEIPLGLAVRGAHTEIVR